MKAGGFRHEKAVDIILHFPIGFVNVGGVFSVTLFTEKFSDAESLSQFHKIQKHKLTCCNIIKQEREVCKRVKPYSEPISGSSTCNTYFDIAIMSVRTVLK